MEDNKCERVMNRISICFLAFLKKLLRAPLELTKEDTPLRKTYAKASVVSFVPNL